MNCIIKEIGRECAGELKERLLFGQLSLTACDTHYNEHLTIIALRKLDSNVSIEDILEMSSEARQAKLNELADSSGKSIQSILDEAQKYENTFR